MITASMEEDIRRIVREEIALDEMRRIEQERAGSRSAVVPGSSPLPMPGTILLDFNPDRLDALDEGAGA